MGHKSMIVVASHNNVNLLNDMLINLSKINLNSHKVLIVDTNSDNSDYIKFFNQCKNDFPNFTFDRKDYNCFDSGAYIHAYLNYNEDRYIFLQDSCKINDSNLILEWNTMLQNYDVVPWINFGYWYKTESQRSWAEDDLIQYTKPNDSIFGPIFAANKKILDKIPKKWLKEPTNKNEACAMEGRWSFMFHIVKAKKYYLEYFEHHFGAYMSKQKIEKIFLNRN